MRRETFRRCRSAVVKVGTGVLTRAGGGLDGRRIAALAGQIDGLRKSGKSIVVVSSGAVGAGVAELGLPGRPGDLPGLQAAAAVGQPLLMRAWHDAFEKLGTRTAQILVTRADFENRTGYLNIGNTIRALHERDVVPVINENDTVAVEELGFTDNDGLAALMTHMIGADVLVILSTVDGLLAPAATTDAKAPAEPAADRANTAGRESSNAVAELRPLDVVAKIDAAVLALVNSDTSALGRGGMAGKLAAVAGVTRAGEAVVIAGGGRPDVLTRIFAGEVEGTLFLPAGERTAARLRWIGQAARPKGRITVDAGAVEAVKKGKSLLPSGVRGCEGRFARGDVVAVAGPDGVDFARGLVNYSAEEVGRIKGLKTAQMAAVLGEKPYDEVVHRDYLVMV
jgi:glutamate 5-kinase